VNDQEKRRAIKEKASKDASSPQARAIGAIIPWRGVAVPGAKNSDSNRKPIIHWQAITAANAQKKASALAAATTTATKPAEGTTSKKIMMFIAAIPPFKGK
jgi:hypothetical protein